MKEEILCTHFDTSECQPTNLFAWKSSMFHSLLWPANRYFQPLGHNDFGKSRWPHRKSNFEPSQFFLPNIAAKAPNLVAAGRVDRESRCKSLTRRIKRRFFEHFSNTRHILSCSVFGRKKSTCWCSWVFSKRRAGVHEGVTKTCAIKKGHNLLLYIRTQRLRLGTELQAPQLCTFQWHRFKLNTLRKRCHEVENSWKMLDSKWCQLSFNQAAIETLSPHGNPCYLNIGMECTRNGAGHPLPAIHPAR